MDLFYFFIVAVFFLGLIVGSFLNVVIYRVPNNISIVYPASHCSCGHKIKPYENIPILSYAVLRARCSHCLTHISFQYPFVELFTGVIFVAVAWRFGFSLDSLIAIGFSGILISLSVIDFNTKLLPDVITLPTLLGACILSILQPYLRTVWDVDPKTAFWGILAGGGPLLLISYVYFKLTGREGMGGGDIKLMFFVGAFLGPKLAFLTLFLGALSGTIIIGMIMHLRGGNRHTEFPFGPFLSGAAWIATLWGENIISWYLNLRAF